MIIKNLLLVWVLSAALTPAWAQGDSDYWSFQEYLDKYPEQRKLVEDFSSRVRQAPQTTSTPITTPIRVAMLMPDQQVSDYWYRNKKSFTHRLQEIGIPFNLTNYSTQPTSTHREQEQLLADALKTDPDYLVLTLNSLRHRVLIDKIMTRGRPKLILMNITTPLKHLGERQPFFYVGFDHREGTKLLTRAINNMIGKQVNYLMLYGMRGYISHARGDEFIRLTAEQPGFAMSQAFYTGIDREKSRQAVLQTLASKHNINLIYACTTDIALGAMDALKTLNKEEHIILNGWGGGSAELEALTNGHLDVTVMRMNDDSGVAMAEAIRLDQTGKTHLVPLVYSGDFAVVDKHTSPQELERLKDYAFRYSK